MKERDITDQTSDSQDEVVERVKARLQEEGREARNLVAYSLPLQDPPQMESMVRHREVKRVAEIVPRRASKQDKRPRSASAGRDPQASLRARHWGFLFRNLQQAVDEIYQTCEDDESIVECKEAIMMLERYSSDFQKLIEWLKLKWEYEHTPPPQRPTSLTWEIRTSSPGKAVHHDRRILTLSDARRALTFDSCAERLGSVSGNLHEKKIANKLNVTRPDGLWVGEAKSSVPGLSISPKPVIIVHEASIDEKQEENSKISDGPGVVPPIDNKALEIVTECEKRDAVENVINTEEMNTQKINREKGSESEILKLESVDKELNDTDNEDAINGISIGNDSQRALSGSIVNEVKCTPCKGSDSGKCDDSISGKCELVLNSADATETVSHSEVSGNKPKNYKPQDCQVSASTTKIKDSVTVPLKLCDLATRAQESGKVCDSGETKRSCAEVLQARSPLQKPAPTVYMNKASQVRQAYNQNRTPQKQVRSAGTNSSRQPLISRPSDPKSNITKHQGGGGKLTYRRVGEGRPFTSPPTARRHTMEAGAGMVRGSPRQPLPHAITRSHSSLGTMSRGNVRSGSSSSVGGSSRASYSNGPVMNDGLVGQDRAASSSSLSSSTSSSGQSWADKVRGAATSLPSSHLSLQDDGEGWEVVRRGRRSHGGSTASLNSVTNKNSNNNNRFSSKDTRSGSLKMDGHICTEIKKRFHMPSSAMSLPSLIIKENSEANDTQKDSIDCSGSSSTHKDCHSMKESAVETGKAPESNRREGRKPLTLDIRKQGSNMFKKVESKKSRKNSKSAEELNKAAKADENKENVKITRAKERVSDEVKEGNRKEFTSPDLNLRGGGKDETQEIKNASGEGNMKTVNCCDKESESGESTVALPDNHIIPPFLRLCDPAIIETSETSDCDDDDGRSKSPSSRPTPMTNGVENSPYKSSEVNSIKVQLSHSDGLHTEHDTKNYDSDSQMDDEELLKNAAALESAVQEEQRLKQQIEETEKTEIKVEDDEDCEEDGSDVSESAGRALSPLTPPYDSLLSTMSWADQVDAFESLEELRHPGRVLHIHEKLSSPSRKRSLSEKMRRHEERLAKAQELRENLILAKTEKLKDLFKKIEEVRQDKEGLLTKKRDLFQRKMKLAEEKRRQYLQEIVNKAHDEENKAKEIAFINGLEAQNKLHDIMQQHQSHESRLADMAEERTRRQEEKAAKEVAAQERRKALEAERQARMAELCEKRRQRCERIDRQQAERREELLEQAREKARDREERLSALQQAQQAKETELVKKIQQKQEESARRHEENIEQIRQRALESSIMKYSRGCDDAPRLVRYETKKLCTLCNSLITSEVYLLSHLRGRRHQEALKTLHQADVVSNEDTETYNLKHIIDAPANIDDPQVTRDKERHKALKRRCRKIRSRMMTRGKEYNSAFKPTPVRESPNKVRISKALQQIAKLVANQGSGPWPSADLASLDRPLLELIRILDKQERADQMVFSAQDGFTKLNSVLKVILDSTEQRPCVLPAKSLGYSGRVLLGACRNNTDNCRYMLNSNLVGTLIDYLMHRLNELVEETTRVGSNSSINTIVNLPSDSASGAMFELLGEVVQVVCESDLKATTTNGDTPSKDHADTTWLRLQDVVSYCVSVGLVDKVWWYFGHVQGPLDADPGVVEIILSAMRLVAALASALATRHPADDPTQLVGTLHVTDACGVVSLLYGLLLHQGGRSAMPHTPPRLSQTTQALTVAATTLLHNLALLDLNMFQSVLGGEGISLEFRHIASYLLWYCSHLPSQDILHNIITLVGYFTVNNKENQGVVQSGEVPSVLQQLCNLPWQYFSETHLTSLLFPTLLACCIGNPDNMIILQQEMSFQVLEDFLHGSQMTDNSLLKILQRTYVQG